MRPKSKYKSYNNRYGFGIFIESQKAPKILVFGVSVSWRGAMVGAPGSQHELGWYPLKDRCCCTLLFITPYLNMA